MSVVSKLASTNELILTLIALYLLIGIALYAMAGSKYHKGKSRVYKFIMFVIFWPDVFKIE